MRIRIVVAYGIDLTQFNLSISVCILSFENHGRGRSLSPNPHITFLLLLLRTSVSLGFPFQLSALSKYGQRQRHTEYLFIYTKKPQHELGVV